MKIKIYVNFEDHVLATEELFNNIVENQAKEMAEDWEHFDTFLNEHYTHLEDLYFDLKSLSNIENLEDDYKEWLKKEVKENPSINSYLDEFELYEIEV